MLVIPGKIRPWFSLFVITVLLLSACNSSKQSTANLSTEEVEYRNAINGRAAKIVAELDIADSARFYKVRDVIARQYRDLRDIHDTRDANVKIIKQQYKSDKATAAEKTKAAEDAADKKLASLHKDYLKKLNRYLNPGQIEKVKDGMTYGVLPITYKGYQEMIPRLSGEERKYIYDALVEAREHAMDAGSSEKKHAWFGKYKGRINNYLSARGYDMNKESKAWQERIKAGTENKKLSQ